MAYLADSPCGGIGGLKNQECRQGRRIISQAYSDSRKNTVAKAGFQISGMFPFKRRPGLTVVELLAYDLTQAQESLIMHDPRQLKVIESSS